MSILHALAAQWQLLFSPGRLGRERYRWFLLTLQAIVVPITLSRTSNLLRSITTLFGVDIEQGRYYTFMASVKLPWPAIWEALWRAIPSPLCDGRLLLALDDSINAKTGQHIFACQKTFDHAAKPNQTRWPWAQTIVTVGLLKRLHGRWSCLPLAFRFYLRRRTLEGRCLRLHGESLVFADKFAQAVALLVRVATVFVAAPVLVVTDSWFGNNGLFKPLRTRLGERAHLLSRLRVNAALFALPTPALGRPGRPRKYGVRLGNAADLAATMRAQAHSYQLHLYGALREVSAAEQVVMLKTLHCAVRVVWVYRRTQWVALMTTDLALSVEQIIEYYSARWKIESGFREIKQEIGSAYTQTRKPDAVANHLHFCMLATSLVWLYAAQLQNAPTRRYASAHTTEFAFADARRMLSQALATEGFGSDCTDPVKPDRKPLIAAIMRLVA
jgi:DDE superfamily endonuclease